MQDHALGLSQIKLYTPFIEKTKAEIATEGAHLNVPFDQTWSCYKGQDKQCGRCGTCGTDRSLHLAGVDDPTEYADDTYWTQAVAKAEQKNKGAA